MKLLFSKLGGVSYFQGARNKATVVGDMGETEGIMRHLIECGHEVMWVGPYHGELPDGAIGQQFNLQGIDEFSSSEDIVRICQPVINAAREFNPVGWVQVCGYAPTMSFPDNAKGVMVQASGARYTAPLLYATEMVGVPRLCINNDPRSYPREQEITCQGWPNLLPKALLSQRTKTWNKVIGGKPYVCREIYAGCENWAHRPRVEGIERTNDILVIAHAHIKDGCRSKQRDGVFELLLTGHEMVYGKGWEHFSGYDSVRMPGAVRPDKVDELLAAALCGPIVAPVDGFYTSKLRTYVQQGCVPLLYGRGEPHTYDPEFKFVSKDSAFRVQSAGDVLRLHECMTVHNDIPYAGYLEELDRLTSPDWSTLELMLDQLANGRPLDDSWFEDYGGYRAA